MERKTELFFDGDKLSMTKLMNQLAQHPQDMEKILKYVYEKVEHFTEFNVKKEHLKEDYDNALQDLYGKYMQ
jgi:hypothetical protein